MEHRVHSFIGAKEWELYSQSWHPEMVQRAVLIIVHGLGEHSGRYMNVVNHLVPQGFVVYSFDHRGHGRSPTRLAAHVDDWSDYREDVRAFVQKVSAAEPDLPLFLMGHSMGGLIVLEYALHYPEGLTGVIASAPGLAAGDASPILVGIGKVLSKLKPDFILDVGLDPEAISRDPAEVEAYQSDFFIHSKVSARWSTEFFGAGEWTQAHAAEFRPPLLIYHGGDDPLVPAASSQAFFEKVQQPDKQLIIYPNGRHESHHDLHKMEMLADVAQWLEAHLPSAGEDG